MFTLFYWHKPCLVLSIGGFMNTEPVVNVCCDLKNGVINEKKAMSRVFELLYSRKAFFGLKNLDDDEMNDFLLYIFESLKKSFYTFDIKKSSFLTYIQNIVRLNYKSWIRINSRMNSIQRYILHHSKNEYLEENSDPLVFTENMSSYNEKSSERPCLDNFQLLAVALKSSYFLTPNHILKISQRTGYTEDYIWKLKKSVDDFMKENYLKNETRIEKVNKSYFYRQRALETLSKLPDNHPYYAKVYKTFIFHDTNWKNRRMNIRYRTVIPVNSYLARLLNVSEAVIIRAVAKAKKISAAGSKNM